MLYLDFTGNKLIVTIYPPSLAGQEDADMSCTIKDVAKVAGVSVSTVSRVINEHPAVKPGTREMVVSAMRKMSYRPNQLARGLVGNKTFNIALAIPSPMIQFYADTSRAIHDEAVKRGYNLLLFHPDLNLAESAMQNTGVLGDADTPLYHLISTLPVDGFILVLTGTDNRLAMELSGLRRPVVAVNRDLTQLGINSVLADETSGVRQATKMLIRLGHRRIGFIRGLTQNITCTMRFEGYCGALEEAGISVIVSAEDELDEAGGYRSTIGLLSRPQDEPLTGLIAINDLAAIGAFKALREHGRRVPEDVSVIGFDNRDFAVYLDPPLTSIRKPKYEMGLEAASCLFDLIVDKAEGQPRGKAKRLLLPTELVERNSCIPVH